MHRHNSLSLRIWHWLNALTVIGLLATYFIREMIGNHGRTFAAKLIEHQITLDEQTTRSIIRSIVHEFWVWHIYFGYALTALFVWRVILVFTDKRSPVADCLSACRTLRENVDFRNLHKAGIKLNYVAFYLLQLFLIISGLALTFNESLGLDSEVKHSIKEAHEFSMWFVLAFAIVHVMGVFFVENRDDPGIVSAMINGGQRKR